MDKYGYLRTSEKDGKKDGIFVAESLKKGPCRFSWSDGKTAYNMYFLPMTDIQIFLQAHGTAAGWIDFGMVMVAIERLGCFHFNLMGSGPPIHEDYVAEKLNIQSKTTSIDIANFFNIIREHFKS